jgi:hypothetical protein
MGDPGQDSAAAVWCGMHRCRAAIAHCRDNLGGPRMEISTAKPAVFAFAHLLCSAQGLGESQIFGAWASPEISCANDLSN